MLGGQLLRTQSVHRYDLHGQGTRLNEPTRVQGDLGNHGVIRYHHGHRTEQGLQVVRQFRSASVTWVHGDEYGAGRVESDLRPLKQQRVRARVDT